MIGGGVIRRIVRRRYPTTRSAATVTVQVVAYGRSRSGLSVNELAGDPLTRNSGAHRSPVRNAGAPAATLSLKLMTMFESAATLVAPFTGTVVVTAGAVSTGESTVVKEKMTFDAI